MVCSCSQSFSHGFVASDLMMMVSCDFSLSFVSNNNLTYMAVGQNLRYLFGVGYPSKVVYFKGFWDVHRGTGVLTHCHICLLHSLDASFAMVRLL